VLHAAVILHLARQMEYFKRECGDCPGWLRLVEFKLKQLWNTQYTDQRNTPQATSDCMQILAAQSPEMEFSFLQWSADSIPVRRKRIHWVELHSYLSQPVEDIPDQEYLHWLKSHEARFPNLCAMACEAAEIPAMSAEAERVCSRYVRLHWT